MSITKSVSAAVLLVCSLSWSQEFRATISGRVVDPQGAVISGAAIRATHKETGAKSETVSGAVGQYVLPFIAPGLYAVTAEIPGFKRYVREGLQVNTDQRIL